WNQLKEKAKEVLQSPESRHIYSMRKYDVEPIFGHLKNVFGIRRTHLIKLRVGLIVFWYLRVSY
ncbi:hypothetical protein MZ90_01245, partial [Lactobacillus helveticus]